MYKDEEFVCLLEPLISGNTDPIWTIISVLDSSFIEEDYRLCIITPRSLEWSANEVWNKNNRRRKQVRGSACRV